MSFKSDHINQTQLNPHALMFDMFHMAGLHKFYSILIILMLVNNISLGNHAHPSSWCLRLLTLLSLTTNVHKWRRRQECLLALTSVAAGFTPLVTGLRDVWVKHTITERPTSTRITVVELHPVIFGLSYLYFPREALWQRWSNKRWRINKIW
jgi:hypothetical protein